MSEKKTRVDFNAPVSLVERADTIADLLDVSRTQLLIDALRDEIDDLAADEGFQRRIGEAYYANQIEFDVVESVLGTEEAMRMKLLRESLSRDPPEPQLDASVPSDEDFYEGEVPEWMPDEESDDDDQGCTPSDG
ncbi:hypothetical protein [Natrinema salinisoli]|uniref:hypothetical protein n=1 Tax=Natrinema salinisoli TaxID=2878535 RepID=UPI001CF091BA|nr:hypothetical protein [Natrinema salinisoli]